MARDAAVRSTQSISDGTGIPLPTVAKLLKSLTRAGLVASHRGVRGGYSLGRDAAQISVADVIEAVEGPIAITACVDTSDEQCCYEKLCPAQGKWNRVNTRVTEALGDVTLADMLADLRGFGIDQGSERTSAGSSPAPQPNV